MSETAPEAAAEAAEAAAEAAEAAADAAVVEAVADAEESSGDDGGGGDTTVVVTDAGGDDEGAHDDEVQLDHEQRITRLEERLGAVEATASEAMLRAEVAEMVNNHSHEEVIAEAAAVAEAAAEATIEAEETGEPASVRIEEPPAGDGVGDIVTVAPDVPEPAEDRRRGGLFRW